MKVEKQNEFIGKIKDTEKLALLSRYAEMNQTNRIETVKLPDIYNIRKANQRDDDGYDLLKNF